GPQLEAAELQILNGTLNSSNAIIGEVWPTYYGLILRANTVIDQAPAATGDEALKSRLVGEAKFLRGWAYFQLATLWGDVPLYKTTPLATEDVAPRSPKNDVYAFAIEDLKAAEASLPPSYTGNDIGRATKAAAQAVLGQLYLQRGDYTEAS